jgi:hypothetical protein
MTHSRKKERFAKPSHEVLSNNFMAKMMSNDFTATPIYNVRAHTYTHITSVAPPLPSHNGV